MSWVLSFLSIYGVKGVFDRAGEFKLKPKHSKPRSIAIFGRNGHGKSGYADAVEYLFSIDGGVEHLGKGGADSEQGGKHAIPHVLAKEQNLGSKITAQFTHLTTGEKIFVERPVITGRNDTRPKEIERLISQAPAHRILRQHDLRRFVVDMTPGQKFTEFARWVGLESATKLLGHLTTAERKLKETDVDREFSERLKSIEKHTVGTIKSYNLKSILNFCEKEVERYTHQPIVIKTASDIEKSIQILCSCREVLLIQSQKAQTHVAESNLKQALKGFTNKEGFLINLKTLLDRVIQAEQNRNQAQSKASQSVFQEVWKNAKQVIKDKKPEICPVCQTPWAKTTVGSVDNVLVVLEDSLGSLKQFRTAETIYSQQRQNLKNNLQKIEASLSQIVELSKKLAIKQVSKKVIALKSTCNEFKQSSQKVQQLHSQFLEFIKNCSVLVTQVIPQALLTQAALEQDTSSSISPIDLSISRLQGLQETISRLEALKQQRVTIRNIERQFCKISDTIRNEIKNLTENAVDALKADVENIYKRIHPGEAVPNVFIDLDTEKKTLVIRVNFHSTERRVPPGGYLSESQINTLGLALFLSSVRLFNKDFPFVFLDDIVSSYDADNRARIVDVIAEYMGGFQIFLTTHDDRFYCHLKQRLETENWLFERITGYDFEKGPKRESDNLRPADIDQLIAEGNPCIAGNALRQFMEEWFDKMCEKYEVNTLHKRGTREYQRTLYDFWQPFLNKAQKLGAGFGTYFSNSTACQKLKGSLLINYYSHHQANPYEWPAIGDIQYIWEVFQEFISLFKCHSCGKQLKYDSSDDRVYCTCGKAILPPEA